MASRNVGSIEVTVEANTGKLRAQIVPSVKRIGDEAGDALQHGIEDGLNDVDTKRLKATLKAQITILSKELERILEGIDPEIDLDTTQATAQIDRLRGQLAALDDETVKVVLDPETEKMKAALFDAVAEADAARLEIEKGDIEWNIEMNTALALAEGDALRRDIESEEAEMALQLETTEAMLTLRGFVAKTEAQKIEEEVDLQTLRAQIEFDKFMLRNEARKLHLDMELDLGAEEAKMAAFKQAVAAESFDAGEGGGKSFADGFGKGGGSFLPNQITEWLPLIAAALEPLAPLVQGVLGGAVEVLSSAFSALAGAGGALLPIIAGLGATLGAVAIGSLGVGKSISAVVKEFGAAADEGRAFNFEAEAIQKTLGNLGPAAQGVVRAFADLFPQLRAIQNLVSEQLFAGFGQELTRLSQETIPDIGTSLVEAAAVANRFFKGLADAASEIDFSGLFRAISPALDSLGRAIANVVRALEPFFKAAAPAARELARWIEDGAEALLRLVRQGAQSGKITDFLLEGVESLKDWARLVESVGKALFTLFQSGKSGGDGLVNSLTRVVDKWNEWMKTTEGQDALQNFFTTSSKLLHDLVPLLDGLAQGLAAIFTGSAESSFAALSEGLGTILRVLGELIGVLNQANITGSFVAALTILAEALEKVMPNIQRFMSSFGDAFMEALVGVASALAPVIGFLGTLMGALEPLAPVIAGIATAFIGWKVITGIISSITTGLGGMNPWILGIGAAIGIAVLAFDAFNASSKEMAARSTEVAQSLDQQINTLLETASASTAAQLGLDALAKSLAEAGTDGEKLTQSLGTLGKTADDSLNVLQSFGEGGKNADKALTDLAHSAGLTGAGVSELVDKVAGAEEPFFGVSAANDQLAAKLGVSREEMARIGNAMEEVQDQAQKTDLGQITREFLNTRAAADDSSAALLKQAEATTGISRTADDVMPLYNEFTRLLGEQAAAANETSGANDALGASTAQLSADMLKLSSTLDPVKDAIFGIAGPMSATEAAMAGVGKAAEAAAKSADAMSKAFDTLVGRSLDAQGALSEYQAGVDDLAKSMEENGKTLDLNTEAGRANAEQIRTNVEAISAWGEAALKEGKIPADQITATMQNMRSELVGQVGAFDTAGQSAEDYINTLGLTPETIETIVNTPGLLEASAKVIGYDNDLDGVLDTVDTEFSATNLDLIKQKLSEYGIDLSGVPDSVLTEYLEKNWEAAHGKATELNAELDETNGKVASPTVSTANMQDADPTMAGIQVSLNNLAASSAAPPVTVAGADTAIAQTDAVKGNVEGLDKTTGTANVQIVGNAIVMLQLAAIQQQMKQLGAMKPAPPITLPTYGTVVSQIVVMMALISALGKAHAEPSVSVPSYGTAVGQIMSVMVALAALDRASASPSVHVEGVDSAINQVNTLKRAIDGLQSKTVTVTTQNVTVGTPAGMTGALITSPMTMNVGEFGLHEALIPLDLPLSRVDPSVRGMAEILRGQTVAPGASIGRQVNVYNTIEVTSNAADPVAVASQVMNRAAAMAN